MTNSMQHSNPNHLAYAVFIAVMIHGFLILGVTFVEPQGQPQAMMEVTMALHLSPEKNPKADFLAHKLMTLNPKTN